MMCEAGYSTYLTNAWWSQDEGDVVIAHEFDASKLNNLIYDRCGSRGARSHSGLRQGQHSS
jgi:hypothetical protein